MKSLVAIFAFLYYASAGSEQPFPRSGMSPLTTGWPLTYTPFWENTQYHSQDELGQAAFGYAHPGQAHSAVRDATGNIVGSYSYADPNGKVVVTDYVADTLGFRVATNALSEGPASIKDTSEVTTTITTASSDASQSASNALPQGHVEEPAPVKDTPEVVGTTEAHIAEAEASKSSKVLPEFSSTIPVPVQDTPEVAAARAAHLAEVEAARSSRRLPVATSIVPNPVQDTPEVASARAAHLAEVEATRARNKISNVFVSSPGTPLASLLTAHTLNLPSIIQREAIVSPLPLDSPYVAAPSIFHFGTLSGIVNTPGGAKFYRVD